MFYVQELLEIQQSSDKFFSPFSAFFSSESFSFGTSDYSKAEENK